ncbi:MAG: hypothetical protein R3Y28_06925, partial [Candidatus Gastranaerophilales bacterium]
MFKIKEEFIQSNVIPNLFRNSIVEKFNGDEMLKPSWIIRVLVGVTSHSNKRVRFSHPTENPQVQGDK